MKPFLNLEYGVTLQVLDVLPACCKKFIFMPMFYYT